jgi:hypothetical protein
VSARFKAKLVVDDEWDAHSLEAAQAEARELAHDIRVEHGVNVEVVSVEEVK